MSDYSPSPDELRDAWINDYDSGMPIEDDSVRSSEPPNTQEGQINQDQGEVTMFLKYR